VSQPPAYTPSHSFLADSATLPYFPGQALDVEFNDVKKTTDAINANLKLIQRDDGALANGSVTYDSLASGIQLQLVGLTPVAQVQVAKSDPIYWGAVCDGNSHPLSKFFSSLAAAQVLYPAAVSLSDELDWAALQKMATAGQPIKLSQQSAILNRQLVVSGVPFTLQGAGAELSSMTWPASAASRGIAITKTVSLQPALIENISLVDDENAQVSVPTGIAISYVKPWETFALDGRIHGEMP
jgi:hypothetical protein